MEQRARGAPRVYCSKECIRAARNQQRREKYARNLGRPCLVGSGYRACVWDDIAFRPTEEEPLCCSKRCRDAFDADGKSNRQYVNSVGEGSSIGMGLAVALPPGRRSLSAFDQVHPQAVVDPLFEYQRWSTANPPRTYEWFERDGVWWRRLR